jgi:hypothetical protein
VTLCELISLNSSSGDVFFADTVDMSSNLDRSPVNKASKAMARCILTGVGSSVLTYLVWKSVQVMVPELALSFHLTCALVMVVSWMATGSALYRLTRPMPEVKRSLPRKAPVRSAHLSVTPLVMPGSFGKVDDAWFQRN